MEKLNRMCANCLNLGNGCKGTTCQTWTGCVFKKNSRRRAGKPIYPHHVPRGLRGKRRKYQRFKEGRAMKLVSIVFDKSTSEYTLHYKDETTGKPYHITANHLLDKEKLWASSANYYQDPYRISWTQA